MSRILILFAVLGLAACAPRAEIVVTPRAAGAGQTVPVFVATTRLAADPLGFGTERSETGSFARFDISVPTKREAGSVTFPVVKVPIRTDTSLARAPNATPMRRPFARPCKTRAGQDRGGRTRP